MLSQSDLNYAQQAAQSWADENVDLICDEDEREHFARYFKNACDEAGALDLHIPSMFTVWRADILPMLS